MEFLFKDMALHWELRIPSAPEFSGEADLNAGHSGRPFLGP
jgi:hypothetical protein